MEQKYKKIMKESKIGYVEKFSLAEITHEGYSQGRRQIQ